MAGERIEQEQHFWNGIALIVYAVLCALSVWLVARYGTLDPAASASSISCCSGLPPSAHPPPDLRQDLRHGARRLHGPQRRAAENAERGWRRLMCEFMQCIWCTGMWSGLIVVTVYFLGTWGRFAVIVLAVAGLGSLLQSCRRRWRRRVEGRPCRVSRLPPFQRTPDCDNLQLH